MMRPTPQTFGGEKSNRTGFDSESGKAVLPKKRKSKSSRSVDSDKDTGFSEDFSEYSQTSTENNLNARIALRAHELYEQRGGCHGEDQADWFEAERQILASP